MPDVVVEGAGPAGLACALHLPRAGHAVPDRRAATAVLQELSA